MRAFSQTIAWTAASILGIGVLGNLPGNSQPDSPAAAAPTPGVGEDAEDVSASDARPRFQDKGVLKGSSFGCANLDDLGKMKELVQAGDTTAALKVARKFGCINHKTGTEVLVEDTSYWHNAFCAHLRGEPECVWMPSEAFKLTEKRKD